MLMLDGYKFSHRPQFPKGTTRIYSNWTPRASRVEGQDEVVFFGLQYFIQKYLVEEMQKGFFGRDRETVKLEYQNFVDEYLGPGNNVGTDHIMELYDFGYVPLKFSALPEGTLCPLRVPMLTVENTHYKFFWLVNYFETLMSTVMWMPCTSATTAYRLRKLLNAAAERTGGDPAFVQWQGHDFSMRGMSSVEAGALSGAGHLLSFTGTDTVPAIFLAKEYYEATGLIGMSVPASEHSVMSCGGHEAEAETFERLLKLYPTGIVSIVSDTWDLWDVLETILPSLASKIVRREGKLVVRPDSGDPVKILCGDKDSKDKRAQKGVIQLLWDSFGGSLNEKKLRVLNPKVGAIYGDSITFERAREITERLEANGYASTNIVLGVGSYTYQYVTRDTFGFAMKATWAEVNGDGRSLFKKPVTDNGEKNSARGRLAVLQDEGERMYLSDQCSPIKEEKSLLQPVWMDGKFVRKQTFEEVRRVLWP